MKRAWVLAFVLAGCVSKDKYLKVEENLARSLELNQRCIKHAEWLEGENEDLRARNNAFEKIYGEGLKMWKGAEGGRLK